MKISAGKILSLSSAALMVTGLASCGDARFTDMGEEKQIEYIENYMRETYNEEWGCISVLQRAERLGDKIPAGTFITSLTRNTDGEVINMWISPDGDIFENRFMLRMRGPAKEYLVEKTETAVPGVKAFAFVTIDTPELIGDYRKDGNVEPLLTEPNLNIEIEVYAGKNYVFRSEDIQALVSALSEVQFDTVDIWQTDETDITVTEKGNSELKVNAEKKWHITKDENGKYACSNGQ